MQFILYCDKFPVTDILPVHKPRFFGTELKQLFYARTAYISDTGFFFDLVKFERDPIILNPEHLSEDDSIVALSFNFTDDPKGHTLSVKLNASGRYSTYIDGNKAEETLSDVFTYKGSDEQGWYWGVRFIVSNTLIYKIYGDLSINPGSFIRGNIYASLNNGKNAHFSSIMPFAEPAVLSDDNHSVFQLEL